MVGTQGEAKHLEAIQFVLNGKISDEYNIFYRIHSESYGWGEWVSNGEVAGIAYQEYQQKE